MAVSDADLRDWKQGLDETESDSMDVHRLVFISRYAWFLNSFKYVDI